MHIITPPHFYTPQPNETSLFLAGGISGCANWQQTMCDLLAHTSLIILNPRQQHYPTNDTKAAQAQIWWEFMHLRMAHAILFWFPQETLCPITLYELGTWSMSDKPLFIGVHPHYARRMDVEIQTYLVRPDVTIVSSLEALTTQIGMFFVDISRATKRPKVV